MVRKSAVLARAERIAPPEPPADDMDDLVANGQDVDEPAEDDDEEEQEDTVVGLEETAATDNVGEQSIEINVESLIAEVEAESRKGQAPELKCARRKLEDYLERKRIARDLEDFEDFVVGD